MKLPTLSLLALAVPLLAQSPANPADFKSWHMESVAPGIYAFIAPDGITPIVSGNSTVIIGEDGVLIVDTGQFPSVAKQEIAAIKKLTPLPVRYIVNTHWHPDHWLGNGAFKAAWPNAVIITTPNTAEKMAGKAQQFLSPKYVEGVQQYLKSYFADTVKHPPAEAAYYKYGEMQFSTFGAELASAVMTPPDILLGDALTVRLGKREVQVMFLGRANTAGDAVVYVPDAKVVMTGDLLVNPYPYGYGSFISEWQETLARVAALNAAVIIPGHGAVEHDTVYLGKVSRLLRDLQVKTADAVKQGKTLKETQEQMDYAPAIQEFCGSSAWCAYVFKGNFFVPAVPRAYKEAKEGKLKDEG